MLALSEWLLLIGGEEAQFHLGEVENHLFLVFVDKFLVVDDQWHALDGFFVLFPMKKGYTISLNLLLLLVEFLKSLLLELLLLLFGGIIFLGHSPVGCIKLLFVVLCSTNEVTGDQLVDCSFDL